jgi:septal ring factor EnvC (AmiA/AmiB activator)
MQLINLIVHSVEDVNYRLYLQQEFSNLGFEDFLKDREDEESEQIQTQVSAYQKNFINLNDIMTKSDKFEQNLNSLNVALQELSRQRENYQRDLGAMNEKNNELKKRLDELTTERQVRS